MAEKTEIRNAPALSIRASFEPSTFDAEKRTVQLTWTTGARVRRGYYDQFDEELSLDPKHVRMERLNGGAPLLDNHNSYGGVRSALGVVESAKLEKGKGTAVVRFSKRPEADAVMSDVRDGIIRNVSVGYRVHKMEKVDGAGDGKVPVFRAVDWEPHELSLVLIPADAGAGVRSDDAATTNPCTFITRGEPQKEQHQMDEAQKLAAEKAAEKAAGEQRAVELRTATEAAVKAERERVAGIQLAVRAAKLGDDFASKLVTDGVELTAARALVLEKLASKSDEVRTESQSRIEVTDDRRDKFVRGATAWLLEKGGYSDTLARAKKAGTKGLENVELDGAEFRGLTMVDLARESLEANGKSTRGMTREQIVGLAFTQRAGGMTAAADFTVLLESVMNKVLLGSYTLASDTWRRFCKTDSVSDFRAANRYRTGSFGVLDTIGESGEFKSKSIPDGLKAQISVVTKGNMVAVTRQAIINDDMGAIADTLGKFGRAAGLSIESDVYALLAQNSGLGPTMSDGLPLFDAGHSNISTQAALSVAAIDADRVLLAQQMDISANEYLGLLPSVLLVPIGLGGQARVLNQSRYDPTASTAFELPNKVVGLFKDVVDSPRLSGTRRYIFTDPSEAAAIVVAFLNGAQAPYMEQQLGWRTDGTEFKIRLDYQAQGFDPKGAITNAG
jgi:hypothetical protein